MASSPVHADPSATLSQQDWQALLRGEVLVDIRACSAWGGAIAAQMHLPQERSQVWEQLTNYPRWVHYFSDLTASRVLSPAKSLHSPYQRLYQAASKSFLGLSAQVEIYLRVYEFAQQAIQFRLEKGSFSTFEADLRLDQFGSETLLSYTVQAMPAFPAPTILMKTAMSFSLPANMQQMRQVLCSEVGH